MYITDIHRSSYVLNTLHYTLYKYPTGCNMDEIHTFPHLGNRPRVVCHERASQPPRYPNMGCWFRIKFYNAVKAGVTYQRGRGDYRGETLDLAQVHIDHPKLLHIRTNQGKYFVSWTCLSTRGWSYWLFIDLLETQYAVDMTAVWSARNPCPSGLQGFSNIWI